MIALLSSGGRIGNFSVYKELDYIIKLEASYKDRLERISKRDNILRKGTLIRRDKEVKAALKKGNRRIDKTIFNNGSREDLQKEAEEIYEKTIKPTEKTKQTVREKYKVDNTPTMSKLFMKRNLRTHFKDKTIR